jgi:tetratricopeptide (TPR) repeat protein
LYLIATLFFSAFQSNILAQEKSTNLMADFSLFYEYNKNNDAKSAIPYGWKVINTDPTNFLKYKIFQKMEDMYWYEHDSTDIDDAAKEVIADTTLHLYEVAMKYEPEKIGYYLAKKAYVLEVWKKAPVPVVIEAYEKAFETDPTLPNYYKDRLGIIYATNAAEDNDYKLKALDLYSKLSEAEPDNALWVGKIENLASDINELVDITKKSWDLDKNNLEKAWKYASIAIKAQELEKAQEPLEFLTKQAPEVINYWKQLASVYEKTDQNDKALNAYKTLISLQPDNRDNYVNVAVIYKRQEQLSVARGFLQKAINASPDWDYPYIIEGQLYEQAARACEFDFMAKCVYLLAVNTYRKAAGMGGQYAATASDRVRALSNSIPTKEDYFFRKLNSGDTIKIEGNCYSWIGKSVQVP